MLNFSSISLANAKVKYSLFFLAYAVALFLYWPSFTGVPIWDDFSYWFYDPIMSPESSWAKIWLNYTWPLSVSAQKLLVNLFKEKWWIYHSINFSLHAFNAWMVYYLLRLLRLTPTWAFLGFVFFLIQPASVISVAWMIQFKTLLCFTLGLGSIIFFIRARGKKDLIISSVLFFLSILSKSSSLPLPLALFFLLGRSWKTKKILTLIPFLLISSYGVYRIAHSEVAKEGIKSAARVATETVDIPGEEVNVPVSPEEVPTVAVAEAGPKIFKPLPDEPLKMPGMDHHSEEIRLQTPETSKSEKWDRAVGHVRLFIKTLYYYFWQSYLPIDNAPVKGLNPFPPGLNEYLHLFLLVVLSLLTWKIGLFPMFLSAHAFLLPYFGVIPAPYMNVTWVSDQHLYLALPCFIALLLMMLAKVKSKWIYVPVAALLIFFLVKTRQASSYYKDNFAFYEASINANFNNIPLVYNLAVLYIINNREQDAADLLETIIRISDEEPYMKEGRYYPYLIHIYSQLKPPVKN